MSKPPIESILGGTRRELLSMSWEEYKKFPALNGSTIVHGRKSMLHLKHAWDDGREDTDAMQFGRLIHCLLFEPDEVASRYLPWGGTRRGNDYNLFCAEAEAAGAEVVKLDGQYSLASAIEAADGFLKNKRVQQLIKEGQAEQTVLDHFNGVQFKGRLDWVSTCEHTLTDLKTSAEISEQLFGKSFFKFGYDIKLGMYKLCLDNVTRDRWPVEVIVLESKPPYDVAVIPVPDAVLDAGVEKAMVIIEKVKTAIETDYWPGVAGDDLMPLHVPFYEMADEIEEYQG